MPSYYKDRLIWAEGYHQHKVICLNVFPKKIMQLSLQNLMQNSAWFSTLLRENDVRMFPMFSISATYKISTFRKITYGIEAIVVFYIQIWKTSGHSMSNCNINQVSNTNICSPSNEACKFLTTQVNVFVFFVVLGHKLLLFYKQTFVP